MPLLTEVDFCVNPLQTVKFYRMQCLFHMPQLRVLDGVECMSEEKVKSENLHGFDCQDREIIFKSMLPEEKFVDRRIGKIEEVVDESDSEQDVDQTYGSGGLAQRVISQREVSNQSQYNSASVNSSRVHATIAKQYVGELISRVDFQNLEKGGGSNPTFIQNASGPLI